MKFNQLNLQLLFDTIEDIGMLLLNTQGIIVDCNVGAEIQFGYSKDYIVGNTVSILHVNNKSALAQSQLDMVSKYGRFEYETELIKSNGEKFWANISLSQVKNKYGELKGILKVIRDMTDYVRIEKELYNISRYPRENPYPIMRIKCDGKIVFANQSSKPFLEQWNTNTFQYAPSNIKEEVDSVLSINKAKNIELTLEDKTFIFALVPVTDYVNLYGFDISDKKRAMVELVKAKEKAELSDKMKSEFLAQMSHEIRTPINVIKSYTALIREELESKIDPEIATLFDAVSNGSDRLTRTMDLILNLSQVQSGSYDKKTEDIDLHFEVLLPLVKNFANDSAEKGIELKLENGLADTHINGDLYSINQIFSHLIDNAIKFTDNGSVIIKSGIENDKLFVSVSDSGRGISKEYLPELFKPFSQEETGYTRSFDGNGLGLALVKKYCELNDLEISVKSKKGEGSNFLVFFKNISY